ncbi:MAG: hypothetical protein PHH47_10060 [Gallionella sp.]|nr:hypothetical protein [Gallionella sp.]MDD4946444.1 hypothetical protein [Gallionella sp.]
MKPNLKIFSTLAKADPAQRADVALAAQACVNWCRVQGFIVTGVQRGLSHPRVYIKASPLCRALEGAVHRFERVGNVERRYWFTLRLGCEVRWNDEALR